MIPGIVISILTFPGIIVHELGHLLVCRLLGVQVHKVCYFRFGNPAGYVVHDAPGSAMRHILIGIGPFALNSVVGALIALPGMLPLVQLHSASRFGYILIWLGVSIAMHAFPSTADANGIWRSIWSREAPILAKLLGTPIVIIIYIGALGSVVWLDLIYGVGLPLLLAKLLLKAF